MLFENETNASLLIYRTILYVIEAVARNFVRY